MNDKTEKYLPHDSIQYLDKKKYGHSCISPWQYNHVIQRS